ncbi:MAG: (2Fe-2S)-binding protein [Acidimicrobiales bacterium]
MVARPVPPATDPIEPAASTSITILVNGERRTGVLGQTVAGIMLAADTLTWRTSPVGGRPRGVFCGIGICFDCLVVVNGQRDVRACQRRARDGDVVEFDCPSRTERG